MQSHDPSKTAQVDTRITEDAIRRHLIEEIAQRARLDPGEIDPDRPLEEFGLGSRDAVAVAGGLEQMLGRSLPATLVWEHPTINLLAAALTGNTTPAAEPAPRATVADDEPIAVIGLGCRLPGGVAGPAEYWKLLTEGRDALGQVPEGRWDAYDDGSPEVADLLARTTRHGGFLDDIAGFDARFFGITPREAQVMDPQQRLVLEVAWEAFEHAGLAPAALRGSRTGVFVGVSAPEYAALTASDLAALEGWTATGAALSIIANRLSYLLDLRGPSMIVDTACSSSLVSTHLAVRSLRAGESDVALAGGVNVLLSPTITITFDQGGGTAPDGRCKAFDASADGMVRAEGCGAVVLKRLSDAERDGDRVLAVIRGSAVNSDGRSNGLVAPNADAQRALLRDVYATTGIDPHEVDYIEAHGTGTFLGDPIEARAMGEVLGAGRPADRPLLIGSVKSNLGHLESAAGIAGLIKTVLALAHGEIPRSLHYREPNPHIPFEDLRLQVVAEPTAWPDRGRPARAGVSGFGFGGTNAHVVLEAAPARRPEPSAAPVRAYPLSDADADRIRDHAAALADWVAEREDVPLADVALTLHRRNGRGRARAAVVARDRAGLADGLRALADGRPHPGLATGSALGTPARPVLVFSGYGAQRPGMARRLLEEEPAFAEAIDDLDPLVADELGFSLWEMLEEGREPQGPEEIMPALFGVQLGLARMWAGYGVVPAAVIGHSMGEVAAAVVAGALSLQDGVKVICRRSRLLGKLVGGGAMAVLGASAEEVRALTRDLPEVYPAVYSSPRQTVVTGDADQVAAVVERAEAEGRLARMVKAEGAGHSPQVDPLLDPLRAQLTDLRPREPHGVTLYTTALDDPRAAATLDAGYWAANLRNPVRLAAAVAAAAEDGHRTFIEVNAHPILAPAVNETLEGEGALVVHTLKRARKGEETDDTLTFHAQLATLAAHGFAVAGPAGGAVADLPLAPWRHERHWMAPPARPNGGRDEHPLLGAHVELPGEDRHAWRADLAAEGWLAAARVHGIALLPAAAQAEMALAAAGQVLGTGEIRVNALWLERPLPLGDGVTVTTTYAEADQQVEIHARTAAGTWVRVAAADVVTDDRPATPPAAGEGIPIEPAARGSRHHRLHPEVLDRCLAALGAAAGEGTWLPESIGSLRVYGPTHRGGSCRAEVVHGEEGPLGAVQLLDGDGRVLLAATGVVLRRVERADVPVPLADKLIEPTWAETDPIEPADTSLVEEVFPGGGLLVLDEDGGTSTVPVDWDDAEPAARAALEHRPARVLMVPPAELTDERLIFATAALARALAAGAPPPRLFVATRGALAVAAGEAGDPGQAPVRALVRVLGFEHPALRATLVDAGSASELAAEFAGPGEDAEVAWRDGRRYAARLAAAPPFTGRPRRVVRRGGSYIITGGYGGVGLVTARMLAERGACRIVLSGRSGPSPEAEKTIARLRESGVDVGVVLGDVAAPGTAERLVEVAQEGGRRLCGVVHGAGVMDDRLVADLGRADLARVWAAKVTGAHRLHAATAGLDLDFFAVHSSAAALLGSPGQGSYAAANAALDALITWRRAQGLPGTTVNWGTWARVGGAADLSVAVLDPISPEEGAEALEVLLAHDRPATGVLRFDPATALALFPEIRRMPYFAALVEAADVAAGDGGEWIGAAALREVTDPAEARRLIAGQVRYRVAAVLGFDADRLDPATPLTDLGLDSLVAVRIKSAVEHDLGLTVPAAILLQGASVNAFEEWAAGELGLDAAPSSTAGAEAAPAGRPYVLPRDAAERLAARIFEDVLGVRPVGATDDFFELGGQDHQADQVVAHLVAELGGEISRSEVFAVPTPEHVAELIRSVDEEAARQTVRPLNAGATGRLPIFIAHPAGGTTGCYQQLVALLGPDRPVYGLERFEDAPSVVERAARYAEHLQAAQPEGPFRLGGWSFGGVLAYETARQLTSAGREVELVALFDAGLPRPVEDESDTLARRFAAFVGYLNETYGLDLTLGYEELAGLDEDAQFALVMERAAPLIEYLPPAVLTHQLTSHQDTRSLEAYTPGPYAGRVVLYHAPEETPWAVRDTRYELDGTNGFGGLCSNLEIVTIPGVHHLNLLDPPGVEVLAAHLAEQLAVHESGPIPVTGG
ncbi:type I polyketide synthase [Actinomadura craniellae]|uniref:type I polyketide synthase n=1 Tax=Actinomadura craniellae TaxID=2231787 RepID=UPI0018F2194F|nr:type I polyketide synthase [Actinomadura craniellae]